MDFNLMKLIIENYLLQSNNIKVQYIYFRRWIFIQLGV